MDKQDIIEFFDRLAPEWDIHLIHDNEKIGIILDYAGITKGISVLDVACGTGVIIPDYLSRDVKKVVAVDISPRMIDVAQSKFSDPRVVFLNADIEEADISEMFDRCVVYNAFPHFPNPQNLIRTLAARLIPDGRLTVAHSMSREAMNAHHSGRASNVSIGLISEQDLSVLFKAHFDVDTALSTEAMYIVSGIKRH
jgi:demethylmenaquinone methyltransferase/2-methoxy-6-polyprenyl-1,4-benzoquinol methylase